MYEILVRRCKMSMVLFAINGIQLLRVSLSVIFDERVGMIKGIHMLVTLRFPLRPRNFLECAFSSS